MPGFARWEVKDLSNRWYKFDQQQKGSSCGPACVKILKESVTGIVLSEEQMRTITAMFKHDITADDLDERETGEVAVVADSEHNWDARGSKAEDLIKTLAAPPGKIASPTKVTTDLKSLILQATRNHPALLFCQWHGKSSAHWVVSMGKLPSSPDKATILDPSYGLQYIDTTVMHHGFIKYRTTGKIKWGIKT